MMRTLYVAGVNTRPLAASANACDSWLLSYTLLARVADWIAPWMRPYLEPRRIIWDPGTFSNHAATYAQYLAFLDAIGRDTGTYLQYDVVGDARQTAHYLEDMRNRGYDPVPILQPGGDAIILQARTNAGCADDAAMRAWLIAELNRRTLTATAHRCGVERQTLKEWMDALSIRRIVRYE